MEETAELADYLPLSFKMPKEHEYIEFLWRVLRIELQGAYNKRLAPKNEVFKFHSHMHGFSPDLFEKTHSVGLFSLFGAKSRNERFERREKDQSGD